MILGRNAAKLHQGISVSTAVFIYGVGRKVLRHDKMRSGSADRIAIGQF